MQGPVLDTGSRLLHACIANLAPTVVGIVKELRRLSRRWGKFLWIALERLGLH